MNTEIMKNLLSKVQSGEIAIDEAMESLRNFPYEDIGCAKLDSHRTIRTGYPEVVFCQGKTTKQIIDILNKLTNHGTCIMATRADKQVFDDVKKEIPDVIYHEAARIIQVGKPEKSKEELKKEKNYIFVLSAGTADIPVAEEAVITATLMGSRVEAAYDVGVAGLHRLLDQKEILFGANVIVAAAGMEGALASVVGGLVSRPVVAVPTSIGYGASFNGLAALLSMLNSCAAGISVVNIDNGFGAGYLAHLINKTNDDTLS